MVLHIGCCFPWWFVLITFRLVYQVTLGFPSSACHTACLPTPRLMAVSPRHGAVGPWLRAWVLSEFKPWRWSRKMMMLKKWKQSWRTTKFLCWNLGAHHCWGFIFWIDYNIFQLYIYINMCIYIYTTEIYSNLIIDICIYNITLGNMVMYCVFTTIRKSPWPALPHSIHVLGWRFGVTWGNQTSRYPISIQPALNPTTGKTTQYNWGLFSLVFGNMPVGPYISNGTDRGHWFPMSLWLPTSVISHEHGFTSIIGIAMGS